MDDVVEALEYYAGKAPKDNKWIGEALQQARKDQEFIEAYAAYKRFETKDKRHMTSTYITYLNNELSSRVHLTWKARSEK